MAEFSTRWAYAGFKVERGLLGMIKFLTYGKVPLEAPTVQAKCLGLYPESSLSAPVFQVGVSTLFLKTE